MTRRSILTSPPPCQLTVVDPNTSATKNCRNPGELFVGGTWRCREHSALGLGAGCGHILAMTGRCPYCGKEEPF